MTESEKAQKQTLQLLQPNEMSVVYNTLGIETEDVEVAAPVRVYDVPPEGGDWQYRVTGAMVVFFDGKYGVPFIKVVDISSGKLYLDQEIYSFFALKSLAKNFNAFESEDRVIGFCFAEGVDMQFVNNVMKGLSFIVNSTPNPKPRPKKKKPKPKSKQDKNKKKKKKKKEGGRWFNFGGGGEKKRGEVQIGRPTDFEHSSHLGFDPQTGRFEIRNIPERWKTIFKEAGVTDEDLQDEETAKFLIKTIQEEEAKGGEESKQEEPSKPSTTSTTPSPPPNPGAPAPPPPPPPPPPPSTSSNAPKAPPPPPPKPSSGSGDGSEASGGSSGGDLQSALSSKMGNLRKVDPEEVKRQQEERMSNDKMSSMASAIRMAMDRRREGIMSDSDEDSDETSSNDSDWD
eukprot:gb/GECH01006792.1/.p1 GENE.gb/GECH01006792.1/~~gb/GECH01006792.1/.p1  ORF type:complete len:399 (+),score=162.86 gb/GECH01006792.1/:1-1197(+)